MDKNLEDPRKEMSIAEQLTYSTVLIQCIYKDFSRGSGTGFIINICKNEEKQEHVPILVTNNHVVENSVETSFYFCRADEKGRPIDTVTIPFRVPGNFWKPHPLPDIDLRCFPLAPILQWAEEQKQRIFYISLDANLIPDEKTLREFTAMEEVIMIGYPIGLSDTFNHKPIIRKGITATHPQNDYLGRKETLLDIAAFPGSSGSPVFIFNQGSFVVPTGVAMGTRLFLLGILYGGHTYNAQGELQLTALPNAPLTSTPMPTNLGLMIKAERLKDFEQLFS